MYQNNNGSKCKKTLRTMLILMVLAISLFAMNTVAYATTGYLETGDTCWCDYQTLGNGARITINATWTESAADMDVGLVNRDTGVKVYQTLSGGSGSVTIYVNETARYAIYVHNPSSYTYYFTTSYYVRN